MDKQSELKPILFDESVAEVGFRVRRRSVDVATDDAIRMSQATLHREVLAQENPGESFPPPSGLATSSNAIDGEYAMWLGYGGDFDFGTFASPAGDMDCGVVDVSTIHLEMGAI